MRDYEEMYYEEEERPRHRKITKAKKEKHKKADHKHVYSKCAVSYTGEDMYGKHHHVFSKGQYCVICGKLDSDWYPLEKINSNGLPVFEVSMWDKEVKL